MGNITNIRSQKVTLIIIDLFLIFSAYVLAFHVRYEQIPERNWDSFIALSPWILLIGLFFITMYELYSLDRKSHWDIIRVVIVATTLMMMLTAAASFIFREFALPRTVILISYFFLNILLISWKLLFTRLSTKQPKSVLFIGDYQEKEKLKQQLEMSFGNKTKTSFISDQETFSRILNGLLQVEYVMIGPTVSSELKSDIIYHSIKNGKIVYVVPDLYDLLLSHSMITTIDDTMVMAVKPFGLTWEQQIVKRVYDLIISTIALIITFPLILFVGILIKLEDPKGRIFYEQTRLGRYNKEFTIYKLRSMVEGAENKTGPVLAGENDPRITKIGKFIRSTRIDELPQFLNVLKGDMSIVGPRPEREYFIKQFEKDHESYRYRNSVKPGITGYAQIMGKYSTSVDDKLRFDLFYIRNYSFVLDIIILFRTVIVLLDKTKSDGKKDVDPVSTNKNSPVNF